MFVGEFHSIETGSIVCNGCTQIFISLRGFYERTSRAACSSKALIDRNRYQVGGGSVWLRVEAILSELSESSRFVSHESISYEAGALATFKPNDLHAFPRVSWKSRWFFAREQTTNVVGFYVPTNKYENFNLIVFPSYFKFFRFSRKYGKI